MHVMGSPPSDLGGDSGRRPRGRAGTEESGYNDRYTKWRKGKDEQTDPVEFPSRRKAQCTDLSRVSVAQALKDPFNRSWLAAGKVRVAGHKRAVPGG